VLGLPPRPVPIHTFCFMFVFEVRSVTVAVDWGEQSRPGLAA
jgi:hypothetical protein